MTERRVINFGDPRIPGRVWNRVQPCPMSGCWLWTGTQTDKGYGFTSRPGPPRKPCYVHRWTYEVANDGISPDLEVDHLCRQPSCCNPLHLELVTTRVNGLRGIGISAQRAQQTHCTNGHEFTPENTLRNPDNTRRCRTCRDALNRFHGALRVAQRRSAGGNAKPRRGSTIEDALAARHPVTGETVRERLERSAACQLAAKRGLRKARAAG